jgi:hypothetical protein
VSIRAHEIESRKHFVLAAIVELLWSAEAGVATAVAKLSSELAGEESPVAAAMLRPALQNSVLTVPLEPKWPLSLRRTNGCTYGTGCSYVK